MPQDYPDSSEIRKIKKWDVTKRGVRPLLQFCKDIYPDYGKWTVDGNLHMVATGGWSGCEEIIHAMQSNHLLWMFTWKKSERGGYYEFEVPEKMK